MDKFKRFYVINSFADKPFGGNPAAIFTNAEGLTSANMQNIARQMNLVETVFISPLKNKKADFELRYFTPEKELPVAGHPTIAAFIALSKTKMIDIAKQENYVIKNKKGLQEVRVKNKKDPTIFMQQAKPVFHEIIQHKKTIANILNINIQDLSDTLPIQSIDTGLGHIIIPVKSMSALMGIQKNIKELKDFCQKNNAAEIQAFTFETYAKNKNMDLHTRNICPREGIEDPGCGVGNGALGAYLLKHYFINQPAISLKAEQGHIVKMPCIIEINASQKDGDIQVWVGGKGRLMIEGKFFL